MKESRCRGGKLRTQTIARIHKGTIGRAGEYEYVVCVKWRVGRTFQKRTDEFLEVGLLSKTGGCA